MTGEAGTKQLLQSATGAQALEFDFQMAAVYLRDADLQPAR